MSVVDGAMDEIRERLGMGAPQELVDFIHTRLERMYIWGRRDLDVHFRRREVAMSRNMRELEERNAALVSQLRAYERQRRGQ